MEIWEKVHFAYHFVRDGKIAKIFMVMNGLTLWIFDTPLKSKKAVFWKRKYRRYKTTSVSIDSRSLGTRQDRPTSRSPFSSFSLK